MIIKCCINSCAASTIIGNLFQNLAGIQLNCIRCAKTRRKNWTPDLLAKFEKLKQVLITALVLAFPDFSKPFIIQTDASGTAIAGVLLQFQNRFWKPIAFSNRKLTETEERYSATELELLAVTEAYKSFYSTVFDREIQFYSDHEPLSTIQKLKKPGGRIGRLLNQLVDVKYKINYIPGDENLLPDFLSRVKMSEPAEITTNLIELKSKTNWYEAQQNDIEIKQLINLIKSGAEHRIWKRDMNKWLHLKKDLYVYNNILKMHPDKLIVPENFKADIIKAHHDLPQAGHKAFECTLDSVRSKYHWIGVQSDVFEYCRTCRACQTFNYSNYYNIAPLKPLDVAQGPLDMVGDDW